MSENLAFRRGEIAAWGPGHPTEMVDGWLVVWMGDYYRSRSLAEARLHFRITVIDWLNDNLCKNTWRHAGLSAAGYRIYFKHQEDAVIFKLTFGL